MFVSPPSESNSVPTTKADSSEARNTAALPISEDTHPVTVQYRLTKHGKTLQTIIDNLTAWGLDHRREIIRKD